MLNLEVIFLVLFLVSIIYLRKTKRQLNNATKILTAISLGMISISIIDIGTYHLEYESINTLNEVNNVKSAGHERSMF